MYAPASRISRSGEKALIRNNTGTLGEQRINSIFRRYIAAQEEINALLLQLRAVKRQEEEVDTSITGQIEYQPHAKGGHADPTARAVEQVIDVYQKKAAEIQRRIRELIEERVKTDDLLARLMPREEEVIRERYIKKQSWTAIADMQFLSERQCQRIAHAAFNRMAQILAGAETEQREAPEI